ncbi:restriction endonuclease [Stenotrophomonas rhizophila]|uniref:restriction endonuclease n=1 Tax=Stenotrophomonas rhizophila TaxID=216778 RepID=UPI000456C84D|nr:restriction endonuclease [Stenotrophomonas rhizophila]AHY58610.1 membrane protein [Stenotrophomonas rhizophila]
MFSWILALLLALIVWTLAAAWFWLVKRRRKETRLGLNALAGMHWRDFSEIVRRAMREQRGLQDVPGEVDDSREPRSDFLMQDAQHRWLLSCKHGRAYRIGTAAVNELGAAARLAGARGGILITEGMVERDGRVAAEKQGVEVLDGHLLWPLLQPYLPGDMEAQVKNAARREAIRRISIAALGSLTLGLLVGMGYLTSRLDQQAAPVAVTTPAATPVQAAAAPADAPVADDKPAADAPAAAKPTAPAAAPGILGDVADPDPATLARYQKELARTLATQPGVLSAFWLTRQTLAVNRSDEIDVIWPLVCTEVKRYPALRTVRIQLNPRLGVDEPVRWRQCATL